MGADRGACRLRSSSAGLQARPKTSGRGAGRSQVLIDGEELRCASDRIPLLCLKSGTYGGAFGVFLFFFCFDALCLASCEKWGLTRQRGHPAGQSCPAALGRTCQASPASAGSSAPKAILVSLGGLLGAVQRHTAPRAAGSCRRPCRRQASACRAGEPVPGARAAWASSPTHRGVLHSRSAEHRLLFFRSSEGRSQFKERVMSFRQSNWCRNHGAPDLLERTALAEPAEGP